MLTSSIRRSRAAFAALLFASSAFALGVTPLTARAQDSGGGAVAPVEPVRARVDINHATLEQLETLPRIGPATARRIIDHRQAVGGFRSVDELLNVRGIGERTLEQLRPLVVVTTPREAGGSEAGTPAS